MLYIYVTWSAEHCLLNLMSIKINYVNLMCELVLYYKLVVFKENLKQMKDQFVFTIYIIDIFIAVMTSLVCIAYI